MMRLSLDPAALTSIADRLAEAQARFRERYPGDSSARQPVHSFYGGAQLYKAGGHMRLGALALASMDEYAPDAATFARALGLPSAAQDRVPLAEAVYARVREKLQREPIEDQRIDFEDGYGSRPDAEEDQHAAMAGAQLAQALRDGALPPFIGIRIKSFSAEALPRAVRTLDLAISSLAAQSGGALPPHFVITLPKVTMPEQVAALADLLSILEQRHAIAPGSIALDLMIESPQAIIDERGTTPIRQLVVAGAGRVRSCAFGPYDYTAACGVAAHDQALDHPAADYARQAMQAALAGTGVTISDGPTTLMPVGPHRAAAGQTLSAAQRDENRAAVHAAWRVHYTNVQRALRQGYYQGWDLHPAQLPARYAAVYSFFLERLPEASARLRAFVERAAQATLVGNTFDDAATGQGLLNFFNRGISCGALAEEEALAAGITLDELRGRSFAQIVANRH